MCEVDNNCFHSVCLYVKNLKSYCDCIWGKWHFRLRVSLPYWRCHFDWWWNVCHPIAKLWEPHPQTEFYNLSSQSSSQLPQYLMGDDFVFTGRHASTMDDYDDDFLCAPPFPAVDSALRSPTEGIHGTARSHCLWGRITQADLGHPKAHRGFGKSERGNATVIILYRSFWAGACVLKGLGSKWFETQQCLLHSPPDYRLGRFSYQYPHKA